MSAAPANKVLLKKSSVVSKVPQTTDLAYGELALNYADGLLYYKSANNVIQYFSDSNTSVTLTGTQTLTNKTLTSPTINNAILTGTVTAGGSVGTNGQVLASTVTGVQWVDSGAAVDPVTTITKSLTLTTDWQNTGISYTDLSTGTYLVQLYANDTGAGGSNSNEYYSGTMSWYAGATNSSVELPTDEIVLHRAGQSSEGGLYLRTFRSTSGSGANLKLQIYANLANSSASNYVFKFRKMI